MCTSDAVGLACRTSASEGTIPGYHGSVTSRMGITMRISPIGPLSGSGGAIEKTMQSCGCSAINVKTENEERRGGERDKP